MAYSFPGDPIYEELDSEPADDGLVEFGGLLWRKCCDGEETYYQSVDVAPIRQYPVLFYSTYRVAW